jgi:vancomycin permeability regulator SanA
MIVKKFWQILWEMAKGILLAGSIFFVVTLFSYVTVHRLADSAIVKSELAPEAEIIMVLGASVKVSGEPSDILRDRLDTALALYHAGKANTFLLSGDNGSRDYDEVNAMKKYLLDRDIPAQAIFLDHAGFDSYDSMYRAKYIFGVEKMIVVTQEYHLPRALYIARALGIDAYGVPADLQSYVKITYFIAREWLADVKAVLDVTFMSKPAYLGNTISLDGSGEVTWD